MEKRIRRPALGLLLAGTLGALHCGYGIYANSAGLGMEGMVEEIGESNAELARLAGLAMSALFFPLYGFVVWAAMGMRNGVGWKASVAASIVAMLPSCSIGCCLGIPIGIWALVVLLKPDVREAFSP